MKRPDLFFTAILVPLDAITLFGAALAAYHLRLTPYFTELRPVIFNLSLETYSRAASIVVLIWLIVFAFSGIYRFRRRRLAGELKSLFLASAASMAIILALLFFTLEAFESRFIVIAGWILAVLFLWIQRAIVRGIQRSLYFLRIGVQKTIIIGDAESAHVLRDTFEAHPRYGYEIVGTYKTFDKKAEVSLHKLIKNKKVDDIIFADPDATRDTMTRLKTFSDVEHVTLRYSADLFSVGSLNLEAYTIAGIPTIAIRKTPLDGWGAIYKRGFDVAASLILIIILSPIMLLTAITILIESGFPILFKNERVGESGSHFKTWKFRSMKAEYSIGSQKGLGNQAKAQKIEEELIKAKSHKQGPVYKIMDDPRVTRFGKFIRKYSIDELPQLFNVLFGKMSLVGPRPHQPREVAKYKPHHLKVHTVRPGITGLAQISGRSDLEFEDEVRLDTFYIENWSPWLDFIILIKTPFVVFFRKGAY